MTTDPSILTNFYILTVGVAGFLLPIVQAIILFITEKSFNKFEFSKKELIGHFRKSGSVLSALLVYLIIQPILLMLELWLAAKVTIILFVLLAVIFRVRLLHSTGTWETLFSNKFIPAGRSAIYRYYRACRNNSPAQIISFLVLAAVILVPFLLSYTLMSSVLFALIYCVLSIAILLNNPMAIQAEVLKTENTGYELSSDEPALTEDQAKNEESIIRKQLAADTFYTNGEVTEDLSKMFSYRTDWFIKKDNGEFWCNVWMEKLSITSRDALKKRINTIVKDQFVSLSKLKTDTNSFVCSFHFKIDDRSRNVFFRSNKGEVDNLRQKPAEDFVKNIKNKLYDEVLI